LLTNATVVDDAIRFVEQSKEKLKSWGNSNEDEKNQTSLTMMMKNLIK
jgi:hypothetical protein